LPGPNAPAPRRRPSRDCSTRDAGARGNELIERGIMRSKRQQQGDAPGARTRQRIGRAGLVLFATAFAPWQSALAGGEQTLEPVTVTAARAGLVGAADSASEGTITREQVASRAWLRPGEVLETVPGLIVTQHSGDGKANQFFLRGFNLDHGTDFATYALGVPVNLPTHAHGQGYTDVNFLIPELISTVRYRKGPYSVQQGDFGSAGSASVDYVRKLESSFGELGVGQNGFRRLLAATSPQLGPGSLLVAGEGFRNDGPWDVPEDFRKKNAALRYSVGDEHDGFDVSLLAYDARWTATDQVARRAVADGLVGRFGSLDATTGGTTSRYSLSAQWAARSDDAVTRASAYAVRYRLNLFSNFTYFLDDPVNGDQFEQADSRRIFGGSVQRTWSFDPGSRPVDLTAGLKLRQDDIGNVGLYHTRARQRLQTVRADALTERAVAVFGEAAVKWTPWLRTVTGLRSDWYHFDVAADAPENSGTRNDSIVTPKLAAVFGPFGDSEFYASYGHGFHSNDARGTTQAVDPVSPLVRTRGAEVGVRGAWLPRLQTALALWRLDIDSELVFVGDAGTTEASRPSRRQGIELANYWAPGKGLVVDADLAWSRARFRDNDAAGNRIPGAIERTASVGITFDDQGPYYGGLRLRYFGPRPLIEDDSVRSTSSTLLNARLGWRPGKRLEVVLDVLNLLDRAVNDIEYFYESRLAGEAAPVEDRHFHPAEPRTIRVAARVNF
jgi:outer membrane receptor protein involved in Fe transport